MPNAHAPGNVNTPLPLWSAIRFWEPRRLLYNLILAVVVICWIVATWPHFRPAFKLAALEAMIGLAFLANLCYCAAYLPDVAIQNFRFDVVSKRKRWILWTVGTLFAILVENYWIADEIYSDFNNAAPTVSQGIKAVTPLGVASNMNFPPTLAVLAFVGATAGLALALLTMVVAWFARKPKLIRGTAKLFGAAGAIYLALLFGFSLASRSKILDRGQEKYFCEIDCHLAYSIVDVQGQPKGASSRYLVTVRSRFDETTTSPSRPKDIPLTPASRDILLVDASGRRYAAADTQGTPLLTRLKPGESYTTQIMFEVPQSAKGLRMLITTTPAWADYFVIGEENSLLHKKTYFAL